MTIGLSMLRAVWSLPPLGASLVVMLAFAGASSGTAQTRAPAPVLRTDTIARVARQRTPSVVFLHTMSQSRPEQEPPAGLFRRQQQPSWLLKPIVEGLGSGVIIDTSGLILTNAHVIEAADAIHVRTPDGDEGDATVVGTDPELDLALLRASNLTGLRAAPLGDSDRLNVGDWVVAIGNPFGLHHTVTAGIISAKARDVDDSGLEFLQTDAAINPGSSGGALFDIDGALVGITTAIFSGAGENIGLNFAIPISVVKQVLPQLRTGTVTHGWIGMRTMSLSRTGARAVGVDSGLVVIAMADDGPAARAGIRLGDIVLGIAGQPPVAAADVQRRIRATAPGSSVPIRVLRDEKRFDVTVEVGTRPRQ